MLQDGDIPWGPSGRTVFLRTYARTKPDGSKEEWGETVRRVAAGNLTLVYGEKWSPEVRDEYERLVHYMERFAILPAGRHLWATGTKGRQYLQNCWVAPWGEKLSRHFEFTFLRLMEGGGVGANYSTSNLTKYGLPRRQLNVHIVCDPIHPDYQEMLEAGLLSKEYSHEWSGAFPVEDSREGWATALTDLIDTFMTDDEVKHENRVYDVSRVRCKGAPLRTFGGTASGPAPFSRMMREIGLVLNVSGSLGQIYGPGHLRPTEAMDMDHAIAECVVSGGVRRSARMSIVHWADPYIDDFLQCKADPSRNWTTNVSVEIDDEFLDLLSGWPGDRDEGREQAYMAQRVHRMVIEGMLTNGEPGYWNSTLSNQGEVYPVTATNPCGEIALAEAEPCNLGHINLDAFAPTEKDGDPDWEGLDEAHRLMTRFLIRATYGDVADTESREIFDKGRRIGVGHLGVQAFLAKCGVPYNEAPVNVAFRSSLRGLRNHVRAVAREYAFELRIPEPIKTTTVAPTGTVAKLPGTTEGIHPIFSRYFIRRIRFSRPDPDQNATVLAAIEDGLKVEQDQYDQSGNTWIVEYPTKEKLVAEVEAMGFDPSIVQSSDELTPEDMLAFQAMYQSCWADNAVSYTLNVLPGAVDADSISTVLTRWLPKLKGVTVFPDKSRPRSPYERISKEQYEAATVKTVEDSTDLECSTGACPIR